MGFVPVFSPCSYEESLGEGRFGPIGVDLKLSRIISKVFLDAVAVAYADFIVFTSLSMNPFNLG